MTFTGQQLVAGRIPGERIATTTSVADSPTFGTIETTVISVMAPVVSGRTYWVRFTGGFGSTVADENINVRLRQDDDAGPEMQAFHLAVGAPISLGYPIAVEGGYLSGATENKTFVVTGQRIGGSGNCRLEAAGSRPAFLYVEYISG